jgi:hypothetical protein
VVRKLIVTLGLLGLASLADAGQNTLTWQDNSDNEANFHIDRTTATSVTACSSAGGWAPLATTGANVLTFVDTAVVEGATYCYRVQASNASGASGYSNVAGRSVPFTIPAAPAGLLIGP